MFIVSALVLVYGLILFFFMKLNGPKNEIEMYAERRSVSESIDKVFSVSCVITLFFLVLLTILAVLAGDNFFIVFYNLLTFLSPLMLSAVVIYTLVKFFNNLIIQFHKNYGEPSYIVNVVLRKAVVEAIKSDYLVIVCLLLFGLKARKTS